MNIKFEIKQKSKEKVQNALIVASAYLEKDNDSGDILHDIEDVGGLDVDISKGVYGSDIFIPNYDDIAKNLKGFLESFNLNDDDLEVSGISIHYDVATRLKPSKYLRAISGLTHAQYIRHEDENEFFRIEDMSHLLTEEEALVLGSEKILRFSHCITNLEGKLGFNVEIEQLLQKQFWRFFIQTSMESILNLSGFDVLNHCKCGMCKNEREHSGKTKSEGMVEEVFDKLIIAAQKRILSL
jgi:hypothetical protein